MGVEAPSGSSPSIGHSEDTATRTIHTHDEPSASSALQPDPAPDDAPDIEPVSVGDQKLITPNSDR